MSPPVSFSCALKPSNFALSRFVFGFNCAFAAASAATPRRSANSPWKIHLIAFG